MSFGFYGKLPQHGDFVANNIQPEVLRAIETFLDHGLGFAKEQLGVKWDSDFPQMPIWRFWIPAEIWGQPICGAFTASVDKVGRKFPKMFMYAPEVFADFPNPPSIDADMDWYAQFDSAFDRLSAKVGLDEVLADLIPIQQETGDQPEPETEQFWAVAEADDFEGLLLDIKTTDHFCAAQTRSYWWTMGSNTSQAAFLSVRGMPGNPNFIWFVQGVPKSKADTSEEPTEFEAPIDEPMELCGE